MRRKEKTAYQVVPESLLRRHVLTVCMPGLDGGSAFHGLFYEKRKKLFAGGKPVSVREKDTLTGVPAAYRGRLTVGSVQWQKTENGKITVQTYRHGGSDTVLTRDTDGRLRKREVYEKGYWMRTDYFSPVDAVHPQWMLEPDFASDGIFVSRYLEKGNKYVWKVLRPLPYTLGAARQSLEDSIAGAPRLLVATLDAEYVYCEDEEYAMRQSLQSRNEHELQQLIPTKTEPTEDPALSDVDQFFAQYEKEFGEPAPEILPGELAFSDDEEEPEEVPAEMPAEEAFTELPIEEPAEEPAEEEPTTEPEEVPAEMPAEELFTELPIEEPAEEPAEEEPAAEPEERRTDAPVYKENDAALPMLPAVMLSEKQITEPQPLPEDMVQGELLLKNEDGKTYRYTGQVCGGKRFGRGRTEQPDGKTAYEGDYRDNRRDGFGSVYYRSGALSFVGYWQQNKRSGLGISVQEKAGTVQVGTWEGDVPVQSGFVFAKDGTARICTGEGAGLQVQLPQEGILLQNADGVATLYGKNGALLYVGQMKDGVCEGYGTCFAPDGKPVFTGEWQQGKAVRGYVFPQEGAQPEPTEA